MKRITLLRVLFTGFFVLILSASFIRVNNNIPFIYMVEASKCVCLPDPRVQTGFRLEGTQGLVTALHGVVGCSHITARRPGSGESEHVNLQISKVDIERDVAILSGSSITGTSGLKAHPTGIPDNNTVFAVGHPNAMPGTWKMELQLESRSFKRLSEILRPSLYKAINDRRSPAVWINVLGLNGDLQPGHSGAPILDAADNVLGIASGGIGDGKLGIGWAIPLSQIDWSTKESKEQEIKILEAKEPKLVFAYQDPDQPIAPPVIRSQGQGCIIGAYHFDLDRGDSNPAQNLGDLALYTKSREERYLSPWSTAQLSIIGNRDFESITLAALQRATFERTEINASRNSQNQLPPGTVLAVLTNEGRYAKIRINSSQGDFVDFNWVTYALPSEGPSPIPPSIQPCGAEQRLLCGTGQLSGDDINNFRVLTKGVSELVILVQHRYNQAHGQVWLGAYLLDQDGNSLDIGFYPTAASPTGETQVRVPNGSGKSYYLLIWMYESYKSEAFVCRRFDYRS